MAKNMARLVDGVVVNLEWCSGSKPETAELREYEGYAIRIGDSWENGKWMRDGAAVLGMIPELTLPAAGWSGGSITVSAEGVTASNHVIVAPSPASRDAYINADVRCTAQGAGTLTFEAAATPQANIGVNVLVFKV